MTDTGPRRADELRPLERRACAEPRSPDPDRDVRLSAGGCGRSSRGATVASGRTPLTWAELVWGRASVGLAVCEFKT